MALSRDVSDLENAEEVPLLEELPDADGRPAGSLQTTEGESVTAEDAAGEFNGGTHSASC